MYVHLQQCVLDKETVLLTVVRYVKCKFVLLVLY